MNGDGTSGEFTIRSVLGASALVFGGSLLLSLGGFAYHAVASRRLGPEEYGALYALISLYTLAVTPVSLLTPVIAKFAAEFGALHDESHVRGLIEVIGKAFSVFGLLYIVAGVLFAVPIASFLHLQWWQVIVVGMMAATGIVSGAFRAIAQGIHQYFSYGVSMASEGFAKVCVLAAVSVAGLSVLRGSLAFAAGMFVGAVLIVWPIVRQYRRVEAAPVVLDWKRIMLTTAGATALTLTITIIGFADVVIVKHFFSANDAGLYSAASLSARILFYFVGFVPAVLIPQATHRHAKGEGTRGTLWSAVVFVGVTALVGVIAYRFLGQLVLHALVGRAFDGALTILSTYAGAMGLLALTNTLGSYALATHRLLFVAPLIAATLATIALIVLLHPSLTAVTHELFLGNVAMLVAVALPLGLQARAVHRA